MIVAYFLGVGSAAIVSGFAESPPGLLVGLTLIGAFAAIYHPVGIPWLIRNTSIPRRGKVLAINGIFGGLGSAVAGLSAGFLIDVGSWRVAFAFIVPAIICLLTRTALLFSQKKQSK